MQRFRPGIGTSRLTISAGETVVLSWNVTGADSVTLDEEPVSASGMLEVTPTENTTYTVVASNASDEVSKSLTVVVGDDLGITMGTYYWASQSMSEHGDIADLSNWKDSDGNPPTTVVGNLFVIDSNANPFFLAPVGTMDFAGATGFKVVGVDLSGVVGTNIAELTFEEGVPDGTFTGTKMVVKENTSGVPISDGSYTFDEIEVEVDLNDGTFVGGELRVKSKTIFDGTFNIEVRSDEGHTTSIAGGTFHKPVYQGIYIDGGTFYGPVIAAHVFAGEYFDDLTLPDDPSNFDLSMLTIHKRFRVGDTGAWYYAEGRIPAPADVRKGVVTGNDVGTMVAAIGGIFLY